MIGAGKAAAEFRRFLEKRPWLGIGCAGTVPVREGAFSLERVTRSLKGYEACDLILALDPEERTEPACPSAQSPHSSSRASAGPGVDEAGQHF